MEIVGVLFALTNADSSGKFPSYVKTMRDALTVVNPSTLAVWVPPRKGFVRFAQSLRTAGIGVYGADLGFSKTLGTVLEQILD